MNSQVKRRCDESWGLVDYYRQSFTRCELCQCSNTEDGILCRTCSVRLAGVSREAEYRDPDVSVVARILREMSLLTDSPSSATVVTSSLVARGTLSSRTGSPDAPPAGSQRSGAAFVRGS